MRGTAGLLVVAALGVASVAVGASQAPSAQAASTDVVFNEILYHPEDDDPNGEFIELFNKGGSSVDLSGWCIDGVRYCFPAGSSIGAGAYVVVTSASYSGALSNGGEDLTLLDAAEAVIDFFEYDDKNDWPALADGEGQSLQRLDVTSDANNSGNWRADPPTRGGPNLVRSAPMPVISKVEHNKLPAPGEPVVVTATLDGATSAQLIYRIGFGADVPVDVPIVGGEISAAIPGQPAGTLIRYRIAGTSAAGVVGGWPRQGDGSTFTGTTVATASTTDLPRFEWFMPDDEYQVAVNDLTLTGDNGYPAVLAYDGEIFDNTKVRVKGQTSRFHPKKKWKFILPAGHELEIDGVFPEAVDEFALHSNWSDKSFLRETIASETFGAAGFPVSQAFPVQLERNNNFYGLYTYVEQPDGTWRDRWGLDEGSVYEVGGGRAFGLLAARDANLSQEIFRRKYQKETNEFENDDELRELIRVLNATSGSTRRAWILDNIDVPSVVNTLAASAVFQHQDYGHKNYRLVLNQLGKWTVIPNDFDLTFGHRSQISCGATCDFVGISGAFEHPGGPLFGAFWFDPVLAPLVRQRMRTVTEEILDPSVLDARVYELRDLTADEALLDRDIWGTYGVQKPPAADANDIVSRFIDPQYARLLGTLANQGRVAQISTPAEPRLRITKVQYDTAGGLAPHVFIENLEPGLVDISSYTIEELDATITGGTILRPGETAVLVHEDSGEVGSAFGCCVIAGMFGEDLEDQLDGFAVRNRQGVVLASWTVVPPGAYTEISGLPGRSAFVNVTVTETVAAGHLQVLECDEKEGRTSNLNVDGPGQTRAGAAVVKFDADGKLCVFNRSATHVIVDLQGYLAPGAIEDMVDVRILDTRGGPRSAAGSQTQITGTPNRSAVVSLIATSTGPNGHFEVLSCGATPGRSSNLNFDRPGQERAGLAIVRFDANGTACIYTSDASHMIADVQGYLVDTAIDDVADVRLLDTRQSAKPTARSMTMISGEPDRSAVISVIATDTTGFGWLQVLPCGSAPGGSSNVNSDSAGQAIANLAVVEFDAAGTACIFAETSTNIVVDLQAYFTAGSFDDVVDTRLVDTRLR